MFKIGYDVSILEDNKFTGVEKLAFYLFSSLWRMSPEYEHLLFCHTSPEKLNHLPANVRIIVAKNKKYWRYFALPRYLHRENCNLFISPVTAIPMITKIPIFSYIHECQWRHDCAEKISKKHQYSLWLAAIKAKILLTNSEFTKKDILSELPFRRRIEVISPAGDPFQNISSDSNFGKIQIPNKYCLFVSTIRPKKNIALLLDVFRKLKDVSLVCAGKIYDRSLIENAPSNVFFTDYVSQENLFFLYQNAQCFLYISRNEGFGLPILEAFSHDCPVIASRSGSIPEVAGDAACYINSWKKEDICTTIQKVTSNEYLRKTMIANGKKQLLQYSWKKSAQKLLNLIKEVENGT